MLIFSGYEAACSSSSESFKVEGIVAGIGNDPERYAAIVNGNIVQAGDTVEEHKVLEVDEGGVTLENPESGEIFRLQNGTVQADELPSLRNQEAVQSVQKSWIEKAFEKHAPNLSALTKQFAYADVLNDLKLVHREAFMYVMDSGARTVSTGDLAAKGRLPEFFKGGQSGGYRFRIQTLDSGVRVYADPIESNSGKKHFMIDEHSYVYAEDGKPATQMSPRLQNGYQLNVQPSP